MFLPFKRRSCFRQPPTYQGPPPPPGPPRGPEGGPQQKLSNNTCFENDLAYNPDMVWAMNVSRAQALAKKQNHQHYLIDNMSRYVLQNGAKSF